MSESNANVEKLADVIDRVEESTDGSDEISIGDVFDAFQDRLFGPLLIVPALVVLTPVGAIPGVPTAIAAVLILVAAQRLFGKRQPWLPKFILDRSVTRERVCKAFDRARPWAKRIDKVIGPRLRPLVSPPMRYVIAGIVIVLAVLMPLVMLIPFAVAAPGAGVLLLGLALTAHDGLLALLGYVLGIGSVALGVWLLV